MPSFIALIRKEPDSDYGVDFPDFPGCVTAGLDLDHARRMAAEALAFHIEGMQEDGEAIPEPSSLDSIMADPHNRDTVMILVDAPVRTTRAVRVQITMPADLLERIGKVTDNRSGFLAQAAIEKLRQAEARPAG